MHMKEQGIRAAAAAALGALCAYGVQMFVPLVVLVAAMMLDYATGGTTCPGKYFPFEEIAGGQAESREGDEIMVTTQMIGSGDRGNAVKSMQGALIAQGYPCGSYGADGICGAATVSAIRAFQTANGLTADGICGQDTWGALLRK